MLPRFRSVSSVLAGAAILAGCSSVAPTTAHLPTQSDCGAAALQEKIGLTVTGRNAEDARVGGAPIASKGDVRVIAPGQAVIQNYSDARLNLETDGRGNLLRASCG